MQTDADRVQTAFRLGVCPDCRETRFYRGPRGGLALNVRCATCGHHFNVGPLGFFAERIRCDETCRLARIA